MTDQLLNFAVLRMNGDRSKFYRLKCRMSDADFEIFPVGDDWIPSCRHFSIIISDTDPRTKMVDQYGFHGFCAEVESNVSSRIDFLPHSTLIASWQVDAWVLLAADHCDQILSYSNPSSRGEILLVGRVLTSLNSWRNTIRGCRWAIRIVTILSN